MIVRFLRRLNQDKYWQRAWKGRPRLRAERNLRYLHATAKTERDRARLAMWMTLYRVDPKGPVGKQCLFYDEASRP